MSAVVSPIRKPLITGNKTYHQITEDLISPTEKTPTKEWVIGFIISVAVLTFGVFCILWTIWVGIGSWNLNRTVNWSWDITNFVWWIGIGHAGTLISAILLLFRQKWRTGVNRAAEAMTIFAVMCAGLFPLIHMGRIWLAMFILPYPNTRGPLWPNFNSPILPPSETGLKVSDGKSITHYHLDGLVQQNTGKDGSRFLWYLQVCLRLLYFLYTPL